MLLDLLLKAIKFIGIYLSFAYILYNLTKISPPFYLNAGVFRGFFPTYISLAIFIYYSEWRENISNSFRYFGVMVMLIMGLVLAGHAALVIGTVSSIILLYILYNKNKFSVVYFVNRAALSLLVLVIAFIGSAELRNSTLIAIESITSGEDVS